MGASAPVQQLGYLVPEFPGQTHIFFWREIRELRKMGAEPCLVSTRRPRTGAARHEWAEEAAAATTYLFPLGWRGMAAAAGRIVAAGPGRVGGCLCVAAGRAGGIGARFRGVALMVVAARLAAEARRRGWAHIHVHSCADSASIAMLSNMLGGPTYSLTLHGDLTHYGPGQTEKWRHAKFGTVVAEHLREQLLTAVPELDPHKVSVAPMGVDVERFRRSKPYGPPEPGGVVRLVACGRLTFAKGHQDIVRAVALLRADGVDARLTVLGGGDQHEALRSLSRELGIADAVELPGSVSETQVRDCLEAAHIYVSGSHDEAVGVATMEAMAMELPVIATRVGGVAGLVRQGQDGLLTDPQRPDQIAEAVRCLTADSQRARRLGAAGRQRVEAQFSSRVSAEELLRHVRFLQSGTCPRNDHIASAIRPA